MINGTFYYEEDKTMKRKTVVALLAASMILSMAIARSSK